MALITDPDSLNVITDLNIISKKRILLIESDSIFSKQFFCYYPSREIFLIYRVTNNFIYLISERVKVWPKNIEDAELNFFSDNGLRTFKFRRAIYPGIKNNKNWDVY
jgi:hypothetical protein